MVFAGVRRRCVHPSAQDRLDHHDGPVRTRGGRARGENGVGVRVVPVVQDVGQQVGVGPGRQRVEEASCDGGGPVREPRRGEPLGRCRGCRLEVDQPSPHAGVAAQYRSQQCPVPTAHVDDVGEPSPVETLGDLSGQNPEAPPHLGVERASQCGHRIEVGPEVPAVTARIGGRARGDRLEQFDESQLRTASRTVDVQQEFHPVRGIPAHLVAQPCRPIVPGFPAGYEDTDGNQMVEQPAQRGSRGPGAVGELCHRRACPRLLDQPERRGHPDRHRGGEIGHRQDRRPTLQHSHDRSLVGIWRDPLWD
ncbi:hypothetical protein SAMN05421776_1011195 [Nocardia farcinica]|uniref:Uncharacterized protein n=1 Tax=Nocardia farcinica TaxID=37329 RepID=A0A0H5NM92_NOCFR|nr:hypothetical protein CJ469_00626 [Nocardia farcinica]PFX10486.1 hypothetical protein CJ468_00152 [Nocardia farcinica]CRY76593.1 Uncharacterised protein [Nocardia farcinica]SIS78169.1 hypothetical protein SAMN05421776_1011195 [Nocardia farcinica]